MPIHFDRLLGSHEQALYLLGERAGVLASNLANADTPGFKARDVDFQAVLKGVAHGALAPAADHPRHIRTAPPAGGGAALQYRVPGQAALDGNTVDAQVEQAAFAENAVRYQATLRFLQRRFDGIRTALRG